MIYSTFLEHRDGYLLGILNKNPRNALFSAATPTDFSQLIKNQIFLYFYYMHKIALCLLLGLVKDEKIILG
jgi:hypothetical protein